MGSTLYIDIAPSAFDSHARMAKLAEHVVLAGVSCSLLEEGTHAYFMILFWEISNRLL